MTMIYAFVGGVNWVDILVVCLVVRGALIGKSSGLVPEIYKITVVLCATVFAFHYYSRLGKCLIKYIAALDASAELLAFGLLVAFIFGFFHSIEEGWIVILKVKTNEVVDRWGGFTFAFISSCLVGSLILSALMLSRADYLRSSAVNSTFGFYLKDVSVGIYKSVYEGLIKRINPNEPFNISVVGLGLKEKLKGSDNQ